MANRSPVTIDILSVIDCERIIADGHKGGDINNPTNIGVNEESDKYVHMVCSSLYVNDNESKGEGHSELRVNANVGDTVQWSITCLHEGTSYNVSLQNVDPFVNVEAISKPEAITLPVNMYVAPPFNTNPTKISYLNYLIDCRVVKPGEAVTYKIAFQMFDRVGKSLGFFTWDPFIQISKN